jgi:hypothetical protein
MSVNNIRTYDLHPDDIPTLNEKEIEMADLMIITRGWVFRFSHGYLWACYPQ